MIIIVLEKHHKIYSLLAKTYFVPKKVKLSVWLSDYAYMIFSSCLIDKSDSRSLFIFNIFGCFFNGYLFLRERDRARVGEEQRERDAESKAGARL